MHQLQLTLQLLNGIRWRSTQNFTQTGHEVRKVPVKIHLHPEVKSDCCKENFHEMTLAQQLLVENLNTKFHDNLTYSSITYARSQTD